MLQNILLGAGLAVDASAVSMTNGLTHPKMKISKVLLLVCFKLQIIMWLKRKGV